MQALLQNKSRQSIRYIATCTIIFLTTEVPVLQYTRVIRPEFLTIVLEDDLAHPITEY